MKRKSFCQAIVLLAILVLISSILSPARVLAQDDALILKMLDDQTSGSGKVMLSGDLRKWHSVMLTIEGPLLAQDAPLNPFLHFRLNVAFTKGERTVLVPGYFAADGDSGQSGAAKGNVWRCLFTPDEEGLWSYNFSFRKGPYIAISLDPAAGKSCLGDGATGTFMVGPTDKRSPDLRAKGALRYVGKHYLQFAETGEFFLKGGADSPENFLAYADFDGTYDIDGLDREGEAKGAKFLHQYAPHAQDWKEGDPAWRNGKGKNMIGAINYLASKQMNSIYFLTMNVDGDGKDVWPWTDPSERSRFDSSKLDQWEIVFSHMESLGILMHVVTQETENDQLLDKGELGTERKLYYRELIARFAHHNGVVWNLGEENTNTDAQRKAFSDFIHALDPYNHPVVCHTYPGKYDEVYRPLLNYGSFEGPSLQTNDTHAQTMKWVDESRKAGRLWFVSLDEIGPAETGVKPDADDPEHNEVRARHLWGNLMAGGAGVEWYFGYKFAHNDLNCEDWRSRDKMWDQTAIALNFFREHLPFTEMQHGDNLVEGVKGAYCFAKSHDIYAVYLPKADNSSLNLQSADEVFFVRWFNPRTGGDLVSGTVARVMGPGKVSLGQPPAETDKDWVALIQSADREELAGKGVWQSLFNGNSLEGWTVKCRKADSTKNFWKVDNGTILADSLGAKGHDYVWLQTDKEYSDFILRFRFQSYKESSGNSGVQIRSQYDEVAEWLDGPQIDIHPVEYWRTGMIWDETRGVNRWLWPEIPQGTWVKPEMAVKGLKGFHADEGTGWNDFEIRARGTRLRAKLNGTTIMEWDGKGILDDAAHQNRKVDKKGHIALQIHKGDQLKIRFKDLRILDLSE